MSATTANALKKHLAWLNKEPREVRTNPDKSLYVPIHIVQADLLEMCQGRTSFEILSTTENHEWLSGCGRLHYVDPISKEWLFQDGMAAVSNTGNLRLDYPALGAHILLNAAKKISSRFGQNLNRGIEEGLVINEKDALDSKYRVKDSDKVYPDARIIEKYKIADPITKAIIENAYIIPDDVKEG